MQLSILVFAVLLAFAGSVHAGEGCDSGPADGAGVVGHIFDVADRDEDGALSPDEYTEAGLSRYGVSFDQCDANGDGVLTIGEYRELYDRHHPPRDELSI